MYRNNYISEHLVVVGKLSFAIFQNAYVVKDRVIPTVGYAAATCFLILRPNSELF